eukprot:333453_1
MVFVWSLNYLLSLFFTIFTNHVVDAQWIISTNSSLPRPSSNAAVGFYQNEIYILGGTPTANYKQLFRYNIISDTFIDNGTDALPINTYGYCTFYTQIRNILYMIDGPSLSIYNFETKQFTQNWMNINIPIWYDTQGDRYSCLTSSDEYLFVVGLWNNINMISYNITQILNLSTYNWTMSYMIKRRDSLSCIVDITHNTLYAIGGFDKQSNPNYLDSIETLITINMEQQVWLMMNETLTIPVQESAVVMFENMIYVIGGYYYDTENHYLDTVHIIDTVTKHVYLSPHRLSYGIRTPMAITVGTNILYCFGGYDGQHKDEWIYYSLPTSDPSYTPTIIPTIIPSKMPSIIPTINPTNNPTINPTNNPTINPTNNPTINPTN